MPASLESFHPHIHWAHFRARDSAAGHTISSKMKPDVPSPDFIEVWLDIRSFEWPRWTSCLMYHSLPISLSSFCRLEPFTEPLSLVTVIIYTIYLFAVHLVYNTINSSRYPHRPDTVIVWQISWINYHCITAHAMLVFYLSGFPFSFSLIVTSCCLYPEDISCKLNIKCSWWLIWGRFGP